MSAPTNPYQERAAKWLAPVMQGQLSPAECISAFKAFLTAEEEAIRQRHRDGAGGLEIAGARAEMFDALLQSAYQWALLPHGKNPPQFALVAIGGYGRGLLNPCSDIDLLFITPRPSATISPAKKQAIETILYLLWDMGLKIGHSVRSVPECISEAHADQQNKTAMMNTRRIAGSEVLYETCLVRFEKECVQKKQTEFLELRREDQRSRHKKYSNTPFLQEPNVKESCGGLRDYHNIMWVSHVVRGITDLKDLVKEKSLSAAAYQEINDAYDFLHRVRNELHYETGKANDILTLRLQGIVATSFDYPQKSILRRTEVFMRDYYTHTRHLWQHTTSLMEIYQIETMQAAHSGWRSFLSFRKSKREEFDGFIARDGRIYALTPDIFVQDPNRLMRLFQHCQVRNLKLSPPMRKLVKEHLDLVDKNFRYAKANRDTFQAILERKGDVARVLRLMHRVRFLGRYLPEFDGMDCLVQHEFFHRYTADEHTLRCVDQMDALLADDLPQHAFYKRLLLDISDPYALYLAVIMHDTGRAEDVREHIDGSTMLANRVCKRLQISGARRALLMFLVDNHLIFWRTATTKNIEDPNVVADFASVMKTKENLDALLLFTYADSNGTAPDAWNGWKESLMRQLHSLTSRFLTQGRAGYTASIEEQKLELRAAVLELMRDDYHPWVNEHFERMPEAAFSFRQAPHIVTQVRTVRHFVQREESQENAYCIKWIDHCDKGYSELILATRNRPNLLEKICCALASQQINILSADFYTRTDGIVVDIFRVCNINFEPIADMAVRKRFTETFDAIFPALEYNPAQYLKRKKNFLAPRTDGGISFPVRSYISNELHPSCTTVEIQALDRIGLLHDLFHAINAHQLDTVHARICTEKGAAVDTLYITHPGGAKITDPAILHHLKQELDALLLREE
jgi:[protein-PII] uridylyltransferase